MVYLGRHQMLDRDVAVKFLLNAVAGPDDPGFAGFIEGARAAARLEHPGLTTIHHADVVDGIPYLVMQYVDGPALSDVLKQTGPLSLSASFAVLDAVSEAIGELHDRGIIHRDIKPGNVMLGLDGHVVVTDFGLSLARPMGQRGPSSARLGGTPAYMAPEMFAGELSLQSDVYALGIMTFALVTGELPYTGTLEEVREKHLHEPLPLEPLQRRGLDPAMIEVFERATHKNPMFRYKTARHFRNALKPAIVTDELLREGAAELQRLVSRALDGGPHATTTEAAGTTPTSTYFDRLAEIAKQKRDTRELSDKGDAHKPTQDDRVEATPLSLPNETVMSGSISRERPTQAATLVADVSCVKCEYNLRGLSPGGRCPECSEAVASSLGPQRLMFAPGSWLAGSAAGLTVIIWALGIGVPLTICLVRIGIAIGQRALVVEVIDGTHTVRLPPNVYLGIGSAAVLTTFVAFVTGLFMATRREPQVRFARDTDTIRRAARILLILFPVTFALLQFFSPPTLSDALQFRPELAMLLLGLAVLSFVHYLAALAARIPDSRFALCSRLIVLAVVVL
ncbi:MAG: serine/threonine protein kinase, partial [Planctomycetes bacterium]|nr:serine/threonine protein kinase [Planctomycetota bacterium]